MDSPYFATKSVSHKQIMTAQIYPAYYLVIIDYGPDGNSHASVSLLCRPFLAFTVIRLGSRRSDLFAINSFHRNLERDLLLTLAK